MSEKNNGAPPGLDYGVFPASLRVQAPQILPEIKVPVPPLPFLLCTVCGYSRPLVSVPGQNGLSICEQCAAATDPIRVTPVNPVGEARTTGAVLAQMLTEEARAVAGLRPGLARRVQAMTIGIMVTRLETRGLVTAADTAACRQVLAGVLSDEVPEMAEPLVPADETPSCC